MVKIISRQSIGTRPVYDIGVAKDHNFLLADGIVASNCFNKSHSMAYGFVTYQTAYLKANYPVEYMAALLTANSGDQDKVQMHIANCISMGIEVMPPNINQSRIDFTPLNQSIVFGLSAIRNLGQGAIECILADRDGEGPFKSLADLCDRVDLRTVNRRALEALIHCGALDTLENNRNQLMQDLELVLDWAQGRAKDRAIGQGNLFDMLGGGGDDANGSAPVGGYESAPKALPVPDFDPQEKLKLEKELLGFYISDHPLKAVQRSAKVLAPVNLGELHEYTEQGTISAIAMLASVKPVVTKKGDRMAIVQLEDLTGQAEGVVFPRSYERIGRYIEADARLMVWGKADSRDERVQFIVEDAEPIEDVKLVMVELDPRIASDIEQQHRLRTVLQNSQGQDPKLAKVPVVAIIRDQQKRQIIRLGSQFRVLDPEVAVSALMRADFKARSEPLISA
ncbi:MAG: OB-fold nucleic acid binding domain-containing protein [Cyanobacteria bacterium J06635_15]